MSVVKYGVKYNGVDHSLGSVDSGTGVVVQYPTGTTKTTIKTTGKITKSWAGKMLRGNLKIGSTEKAWGGKVLRSDIDIITALVSADGYDIITSGSGEWHVPPGVTSFTAYLIGGGGGGAGNEHYDDSWDDPTLAAGGGGGGGYLVSHQFTNVHPYDSFSYSVGAGGNGGTGQTGPRKSAVLGSKGGTTTFGDYSVEGGNGGGNSSLTVYSFKGGNGGTGGGAGGRSGATSSSRKAGGNGGSNGADGGSNVGQNYKGLGDGQSKIVNGAYYCGGGGGGGYLTGSASYYGSGGTGGGGHGGGETSNPSLVIFPVAGTDGTGGGGGGGGVNYFTSFYTMNGAKGGTGAIIIIW